MLGRFRGAILASIFEIKKSALAYIYNKKKIVLSKKKRNHFPNKYDILALADTTILFYIYCDLKRVHLCI